MTKVLVIGKGGREHTLVWKLSQSSYIEHIFCAPGNAGTEIMNNVTNVPINEENFSDIGDLVMEKEIDLTFVGPEAPLVNGIVNYFWDEGLIANNHQIFGPTKEAAQLEGSKVFAKLFMIEHGIPTAEFNYFSKPQEANSYIKGEGAPIVVKADGLAAGKGSKVCMTIEDAIKAVDDIMVKKEFGDAGNKVVIEDFMKGEEASILALSDGKTVRALISSQDHKPVFENESDRTKWLTCGGNPEYSNHDKGPNTGGMGVYAPAPVVTGKVMNKVCNNILIPTIEGMAKEGIPFIGCLYVGLMINNNEPRVVEYNVRFGDPEAQVVLPMLQNDLYLLANACIEGRLHERRYKIVNNKGAACCVDMASGGYPGGYEKGKEISGLNQKGGVSIVNVFHAGTKMKDNRYFTNGGRVLGVTGTGINIKEAIGLAYLGVNYISWDNEFHRTDIGQKALRR